MPFVLNCHTNSRNFCRSLHAEKLAIKKFFKRGYNPNLTYTLFSIRIRNNRLVHGGKPCSMCTKMLEKISPRFIQNIYYF